MEVTKRMGVATVRRTLSFRNFLLRFLLIIFWLAVQKFCTVTLPLSHIVEAPIGRLIMGGEAVLDWALICFSAYLFLARFTMHYAIFYGVSRLVGDLEIFLLSPAFSPRSDDIVGGDEKLKLAWRKAGWLEKWWKVEVATDCLMPSGPGCTVVSFTSSEVWR